MIQSENRSLSAEDGSSNAGIRLIRRLPAAAWIVLASLAVVLLAGGGLSGFMTHPRWQDHGESHEAGEQAQRGDMAGVVDLPSRWIVAGPSMAPTLVGPSVHGFCRRCQLRWCIEEAALRQSPHTVLCSHCGERLKVESPAEGEEPPSLTQAIVTLRPLIGRWLPEPGQPVAARTPRGIAVDPDPAATPLESARRAAEGSPAEVMVRGQATDRFVKRLVAIPGDVVAIDTDGQHLTVNGERIEDRLAKRDLPFPLPRFLVDQDARRDATRSHVIGDPGTWKRDADRQWVYRGGDRSDWLVYSHRSVYDQQRVGPVLDDYQYNTHVSRKLLPVDRFFLSGRCESAGHIELEIAFWSSDQSRSVRIDVEEAERFETSTYRANPASDLPVSPSQPIAIRARGASLVLSELVIERLIEYRLRTRDSQDRYPLRQGSDEVFLLGDNTPVSFDSREFGPLPMDQIEAVVIDSSF